jgi:phage baseplate assembly protein W
VARDFKSVGIKLGADQQDRVASSVSPPIGITTPLALDNQNRGLLTMHYDLSDQILDNLRNLVMTNHGERVGVYDFGANLRPLTLELTQPVWEEEAMVRIKTAVAKFMPYVDLQTFEVNILGSSNMGMSKVAIRMTYTVQDVQDRPRAIEIIMYIAG